MNALRCSVASAGWMLMVIAQPVFADAVVYDNTTTDTGMEVPLPSLEGGNEITLAGTERLVTEIEILLRHEGEGPATFEARFAFYMNDGYFENSPGTRIWQSERFEQTIDAGTSAIVRFDVPGVLVPDTFIWTVDIVDIQGTTSGLNFLQFFPPTTGAARMGFWRASTGPVPWLFDDQVFPLWARVTADSPPIPAVSEWGTLVMLLGLLTVGTITFRRSRHRRPFLSVCGVSSRGSK